MRSWSEHPGLSTPIPFGETKPEDIIFGAALATKADSEDAIDAAVLKAVADPKALDRFKQTKLVPFDPVNKRTMTTVVDANGRTWQYAKGAPQAISGLCKLAPTTEGSANALGVGVPHGHWKTTTFRRRADHARHDRPLRARRSHQPIRLRDLCREGSRSWGKRAAGDGMTAVGLRPPSVRPFPALFSSWLSLGSHLDRRATPIIAG